MMELSLAYLFAAGLIAGLVFLAKRNQKQGWRKPRVVWFEAQEAQAMRAFVAHQEAPPEVIMNNQPLRHLSDLDRLQQSLVAHGNTQRPEIATTEKKDDLAPHSLRSR